MRRWFEATALGRVRTAAFPVVCMVLLPVQLRAAELCRFAGTTDYDGKVGVTTSVSVSGDVTRVDVAVTFEATTMFWLRMHYLVEEISFWRGGVVQDVALNTREFVNSHIVRQQWDRFRRAGDSMKAQRVQGKTLQDFAQKHPGFVQHWDPATFSRPWLQDYDAAKPETRPDLDFDHAGPALKTPLALAFYWVRYLPAGGATFPVLLLGFKADKRAELPITGAQRQGAMVWHAPLRHPDLSASPVSSAEAVTSPDHHLLDLSFDLFGPRGSAHGDISQVGCTGSAAR